ncbi:Retrovirus-related Pol polyprotein from transposon 17.6 [Labeo rohita]|uniref:ribonuclease H n=1 Tax=Labeo rohita TaxID=84645 RepID=A0ABQ8MQ40_LABRO|nr:Retrovirus-related Pol polyprotein from transposon 17.6 [Labeo rohita]
MFELITSTTYSTPSVSLSVSSNHHEVTKLYLCDFLSAPIVLGHLWLVQHGPHVDWSRNSLLAWSQSCLVSCLGAASTPGSVFPVLQVEAADLTGVPMEYHLCQVCSKAPAMSLPPHQPYDCAIDLLPDTSPPKGHLYSLWGPESIPIPLMSSAFELLQGAKTVFNTATGQYEYLVLPFGLTNSPAVFQALVNDVLRDMLNKFVFVYLDDILIFSPFLQVLQWLLENQLFVKAEKCEFHAKSVTFLGYVISVNRVKADPAKVRAVAEWPVPNTRKALQRFLGFINFYRSIVKVDASDVGVGMVLSQRSPKDWKVHACAFFSHRLSPAEHNYDTGNRELLAVRLALGELRHWLEGSAQLFLVWTDHKNL